MRLENSTALETEWLRRVVEAVRPPGLDDFTIIYLPGNYLGSADGLLRVARVWVSAPLPEGAVALHGRVVLRNLEEVLVQLTAHELYHLVQYDRGECATHRDPWQCRLERRANAYAARQVRRYRRFQFSFALSQEGKVTIDVSKLNAQELDQLIAEAMQMRWHMKPGVPNEMPKMAAAVFDPRWFVSLDGENTILQLRHPAAGWVAFAFPPHERAHILSLLLQQALAPKASGQIPVPIAGGGAISLIRLYAPIGTLFATWHDSPAHHGPQNAS